MEAHHFAQNQVPAPRLGADLNDLAHLAFHVHGRLQHARRADKIARHGGQPGDREFIRPARVVACTLVNVTETGDFVVNIVSREIAEKMNLTVGGMAVLTKFSRGYERDSDLNGARMMAAAGYNPMDMARFFETLAKQSGRVGRPSGLEQWLSSHPDPGNRSQYVAQDTQFYPKRDYSTATGRFPRVKQAVASLPPPKLKPAALLAGKQGSGPRTNLPAGFKDLQAVGFAVAYPSTWQAGQAQQGGGSLYLVPQGGATQSQNGGLELLVGGMIDYYRPEAGAAALDATTAELLRGLEKEDTNLRAERPGRIDLGGKPALLTRIATKPSVAREPEQTVLLYTVVRNEMLWHLVLAAPPSRWNELEPVFRQISQSVQFPD